MLHPIAAIEVAARRWTDRENRSNAAPGFWFLDTLVVWRLDRLGRTAQGLTSLFEDLIRWKVNLLSLKDGLDLVTPAGRLMANILAEVAA